MWFLEWIEVPREGLSGGLLLGWMRNQSFSIQYNLKNLLNADLLDNKGIKKLSKQIKLSIT